MPVAVATGEHPGADPLTLATDSARPVHLDSSPFDASRGDADHLRSCALTHLAGQRNEPVSLMREPLFDPPAGDDAPISQVVTSYDEERLLTYVRLLDAASRTVRLA